MNRTAVYAIENDVGDSRYKVTMAAALNRKRSPKEYRFSICNKIFDSGEALNSHLSKEKPLHN